MIYVSEQVKQKKYAYATSLLRMNCYADLHEYFSGTNDPLKEMSESVALFKAVERLVPNFDFHRKNSPFLVCVVGDGTTPRTASLFAVLTRWQVLSIDPKMRVDKKSVHKLDRLTAVKSTLEDYDFSYIAESKAITRVLVYPHSHADFTLGVQKFKPHYAVTMPCCYFKKQTLDLSKVNPSILVDEVDDKVMSPQNRILSFAFNWN